MNIIPNSAAIRHLTTGQHRATVSSSMETPILIKVERSKIGRNHYRYTGIFNDGSKQSHLSRRFFQYGYSDPEGVLFFSKTKPTGQASTYVAIREAPTKSVIRKDTDMKAKATATKTAKKPAASKAAKKGQKEKKSKRIDTGYVAAIRDLLLKGKYTIAQASAKIKEQFPDKEMQSIKRIAANVAKRMRKNPDTKDVRWVPGAPENTGYMARIDELLRGGKHTTRQIGETVAKEFEKNVVSAKKVVRARLKRLRDSGDKTVKPLLEADIREEKPAKKAKATPKPAKAKGKVKTPAKAAKAKGKTKEKAAKAKAAALDAGITPPPAEPVAA